MNTAPLPLALFISRLPLAAFFLVWSVQKIVKPETTGAIAQSFYGVALPGGAAVLIGIVQTAIVLAFLAGLAKTWTYGALLAMHAVTVLVTLPQILNPYHEINHLFVAAVPVLGALIAQFLLRGEDRLLTLAGATGAWQPPDRLRGNGSGRHGNARPVPA